MEEPRPEHKPFVPAEKTIPEFTAQALILGVLLALVMCAANTYVGLFAGMTVSASIPAAVISMGILRGLMKRGTILENNIVQTIASTGESLAAGIIFTVPALVLTGAWDHFDFWQVTLISLLGGTLGILFMIPIRRALIVKGDKELTYPEGVACAEVLEAGEKGGAEVKTVFAGLGLGAAFKFLSQGLSWIPGVVEKAGMLGRTVVYGGMNVSPMLMGVGYIIGLQVSLLVFAGGLIGWALLLPIFSNFSGVEMALTLKWLKGAGIGLMAIGLVTGVFGIGRSSYFKLGWVVFLGGLVAFFMPEKTITLIDLGDFESQSALDIAWTLWSKHIRYVGVGAMVVGGIWSIISVRKGIVSGITTVFGEKTKGEDRRTDRDMRMGETLPLLAVAFVGVLGLYYWLTNNPAESFWMSVIMVMAAFFFVAVSSYIVGLVGSSNNPVSGMTITTVLFASGLLLLLGYRGESGVIAALGIAGVVCCAACTAGDVSQDLKTGYLVGATPRYQQWAEIIGVAIPAFIIAPVLTLLHQAYTIGSPELSAPQASLFASIAQGIFGTGGIPWSMVIFGAIIGLFLVVLNELLKENNSTFRSHCMPVAVGIYLPLELSVPIFIGGVLRQVVSSRFTLAQAKEKKDAEHRGMLASSGLVAGEAVMGIILAILIVWNITITWTDILGWVALALVAWWIWWVAIRKPKATVASDPAQELSAGFEKPDGGLDEE